jgi:GBS Bsp-like repeat.
MCYNKVYIDCGQWILSDKIGDDSKVALFYHLVKERKLLKKKKIISLALAMSLLTSTFLTLTPKEVQATTQIPNLNVYQLNNHAKLEWSVEMLSTDVITQTSFEPGQETPNFVVTGSGTPGNQSLVSGIYSDGSRSVQLTNTSNWTGNEWWYPASSANSSVFNLPAKRIPNGTTLSINLKARAVGGSDNYITFSNNSPWGDRGTPFTDRNGRVIKFAQSVNFSSPPSQFSIYVDGGAVSFDDNTLLQLITSKGTNHDYQIFFYRWNQSLGKLVRDYNGSDIRSGDGFGNMYPLRYDTFNVGDAVLSNQWVYVGFNGRSIPGDGTWNTLTSNTVMNSDIYNFYNQGFIPQVHWRTNGNMYVDSVKFGYATQANVWRNGTQIYSGYLSDYEDYQATDNVKPNSVGNLNASVSNGTANINWSAPSDNGSTYNYQIQGSTVNGQSIISQNYPLTVTSGIKGYSIVVDNNPNTVPDNVVDTTATGYSVPVGGSFYTHVASIDNAGNISSVNTIFSDVTAPTATSVYTQNVTKDGYDVIVTGVSDDATGVNRVQFPTWTNANGQDDLLQDWMNNANVKGTDLGGGTWKFHVNRSAHNNEYGWYTTHVYGWDNAGNYRFFGGVSASLDVTPPTVNISVSTGGWTNQGVTLTVNASDSESGVKRVQLPDGNWVNSGTVSFTTNTNGTYTFVVEDNLGNQTTKTVTVSNVDTTNPTLNVVADKTTWTNQNINLTANSSDGQSGMANITLPNGQVVNGSTASYSVGTNGTYQFIAKDNVGNSTTVPYTVSNIDTIAPNVSLSLDTNLITNKTVTINVSSTDTQSGVSTIKLPNGQIVNSSNTTYTVSGNGSYIFEVTDSVGNKKSASINVSNIININTISDIDHIDYKLDGATVQDWTKYSGAFNVINEGITTVTARAVDKAGNVSDTASTFVKIDRSKPINGAIQIIIK